MSLLVAEARRAMRRRAVRVLIGIALLGCAFAGVVAFVTSSGKSASELRGDDGHPAVMAHWWIADAHEGFLSIAMFFLFLGGFFGGATVAGAEWRAGTVTTVLTWEPRRLRVHGARTASAALLACLIAFALQLALLAATLPAVLANGSTEGVDGSFWSSLVVAMVRTSVVTAAAAALAVALATIGRNTAFALIAMFTWLIVVEGLIRGLAPSLARWLWAENLATVMAWSQMDTVDFVRSPVVAATTLAGYGAFIAAAATVSFQRRDVPGST